MSNLYDESVVNLGVLTGLTAVLGTTKIDASRLQGVQMKDIRGSMRLDGKTTSEGPIGYGFSIGLNAVEVAACLVADPQRVDDPSSEENANFRVFPIAVAPLLFTSRAAGEILQQPWVSFNFPSWKIYEGVALNTWAFNYGGVALTTGAVVRFNGMYQYDWLRD